MRANELLDITLQKQLGLKMEVTTATHAPSR
jgi:hypothetical protein